MGREWSPLIRGGNSPYPQCNVCMFTTLNFKVKSGHDISKWEERWRSKRKKSRTMTFMLWWKHVCACINSEPEKKLRRKPSSIGMNYRMDYQPTWYFHRLWKWFFTHINKSCQNMVAAVSYSWVLLAKTSWHMGEIWELGPWWTCTCYG